MHLPDHNRQTTILRGPDTQSEKHCTMFRSLVGTFGVVALAILEMVLATVPAAAQSIHQYGTFATLPQFQTQSYENSSNPLGTANLSGANQVKVGPDGAIYVADYSNLRLVKYVSQSVSGYSSCPSALATVGGYCQYLLATPGFRTYGIAVDAANDVYFTDYDSTTAKSIFYLKYVGLPGATGAGINGYGCTSTTKCASGWSTIVTNSAIDAPRGLWVDSYGNIFSAAYTGSNLIMEHPTSAVTPGTTPPLTTAGYIETIFPVNSTFASDVIDDAYGNVFVASYGGTKVLEYVCGTGSNYTQATAVTSAGTCYLGSTGTSPSFAVPNTSTVTFATATSSEGVNGVTLDAGGNLYVSYNDHTAFSGRIYEFPTTGPGAYSTIGFDVAAGLTAPFNVGYGGTMTPDNNVGLSFDPTHPTTLYVMLNASSGGALIAQLTLGANGTRGYANLGNVAIGSSVTVGINMVATASVNPTAITAVTLGSLTSDFAVTSSLAAGSSYCNTGGTAIPGTNTYTSIGGGCVVQVTFTPTVAGTEQGAVLFKSGTALLGWAYISGTGVGPQASFNSGTEKVIASGLSNAPTDLTVDGAGNIYYTATGATNVTQLAAGTYTPSNVVASSGSTNLSNAKSIAVDGADILYVAQASGTHVQKYVPAVPYAVNTYTQSSYGIGTALTSSGGGVYVDSFGSVYIANTGASKVQIEPWMGDGGTNNFGWGTEVALTATAGLTPTALAGPKGVTVDSSGDVIVSDSGNNRVVKFALSTAISGGVYVNTYTPSLVTSTPSNPGAVAVDANGDIYIADTGHNQILKETLSGGIYTETVVATSTLNAPVGIALTSNGNLYIADTGNNRIIEEDFADAPTLTASAVINGTAPTQTITVINDGNAALTLSANPTISGAGFSLGSSSSLCQTGTVAAGSSCTLPVSFAAPSSPGASTGSIVLADNSLTGTTTNQTINLSGSGYAAVGGISFNLVTEPVGTAQNFTVTVLGAGGGTDTSFTGTITFSSSDSAATLPATYTFTTGDAGVHTFSVIFGTAGSQSVTVSDLQDSLSALQSATITPKTQSITFPAVASTVQYGNTAPILLAATASSGLTVTYTVTGPASLSGSNLVITGPGTVNVTANQSGNSTYAAATAVSQTVVATPANFTTVALSSQAVGTSSVVTVVLNFNASFTLGSLAVTSLDSASPAFGVTTGGTCAVGTSYTPGTSCTVNLTYSPTGPGVLTGTVSAYDNSSATLLQAVTNAVAVRYQ